MKGPVMPDPIVVQLTPASPVTFEAPLRFATEADWVAYLESWTGVRENLDLPAPIAGVDYQLINLEG